MSDQKEQSVVDLVDAGVPADQGLSSLGLLMQLAGNVLAACGSLLAFTVIFLPGGADKLWALMLLGLSVARSMSHRAAGTQLLYGPPPSGLPGLESGKRMAGIRRYITFAAIHTAVFAAIFLVKLHAPIALTLGLTCGLAAWPVALAILINLPRFRRFRDDLPLPEDKGFEGAALLMTVLGLAGLVGAGTALLGILGLPGRDLQRGPGVLVALAIAMLVVRSVIHVQAGISGLRETSVDRSVELANRYANFGVISSFCGGGALLMFLMNSPVNVAGLVLVAAICWMLMAWPLIIRRFFSERQFADLLAGDQAPVHRRAPDAGLTALGWLLFGHAVLGASLVLPTLFSHGTVNDEPPVRLLYALGGDVGLHSVWWGVGLIVLQLWAGYELVRMSPQSRVIATVFGVVGTAVALFENWPLIDAFRHMHGMLDMNEAILLGPLALALIIPVATVILVNRQIAPTARARFRTKPAGEPPQA